MAYKYPEDDQAGTGKMMNVMSEDCCEIIYESDRPEFRNPEDSREIYEKEDSKKRFNECTKNPGHPTFIPVNEFCADHLPLELRAKENIMDIIKHKISVTVRVRASYTSLHRPDTFADNKKPYTHAKYKGMWVTRFGTGNISERLPLDPVLNTPCPCLSCRTPGTVPKMIHYKVVVCTATHVIYDNEEAEQTTFDCFYDSVDDIPGKFRLYGLHLQDSTSSPSLKHQTDFCEVVCVTHDIDTINKIDNTLFSPRAISAQIHGYGVPGMIVSHPHGCSKRITFGDIEYLTVLIGPHCTTEKPFLFNMGTKCRRHCLDKEGSKKDEDQPGKAQMGHGSSKTKKDEDQSGRTQMGHGSSKTTPSTIVVDDCPVQECSIKNETTKLSSIPTENSKPEDNGNIMCSIIKNFDCAKIGDELIPILRFYSYHGCDIMTLVDSLIASMVKNCKAVGEDDILFMRSITKYLEEPLDNIQQPTMEHVLERLKYHITVAANKHNNTFVSEMMISVLESVERPVKDYYSKFFPSTKSFVLPDNSCFVYLPFGSTFILPKEAKYVMRYYKGTPGLFQFPKGTTFRTKDGEELLIPDDSQFESPLFLPQHFHAVYTTGTCAGSSGAFVCTDLMSKGSESVVHYLTHTCSVQGKKTNCSGKKGYECFPELGKDTSKLVLSIQSLQSDFEKKINSIESDLPLD